MRWVIIGKWPPRAVVSGAIVTSPPMVLTDTGWLHEWEFGSGEPGPHTLIFEDKAEADRVGVQHALLGMEIRVEPDEVRRYEGG